MPRKRQDRPFDNYGSAARNGHRVRWRIQCDTWESYFSFHYRNLVLRLALVSRLGHSSFPSHDQHWAMGVADHALGRAAHEYVGKAAVAVGGDDDHVHLQSFGCVSDLAIR